MDRITSSADISQLFKQGKRVHTPYLTMIVMAHECDRGNQSGGRVAFIAGKKLGNAVWRNAAKRRMRAVCQELQGPWEGYDIIFLAKGKLIEASYQQVLSACRDKINQLVGQEGH